MDYEKLVQSGFPLHPCKYCLKRPSCSKRCIDYWKLACRLRDGWVHMLEDSSDELLYNYLTLENKLRPDRYLDRLPKELELTEWLKKF